LGYWYGAFCDQPAGKVTIDAGYVAANGLVVREQLQKAGVRLTHLLDAALDKEPASGLDWVSCSVWKTARQQKKKRPSIGRGSAASRVGPPGKDITS
jgi:hypothetical protein